MLEIANLPIGLLEALNYQDHLAAGSQKLQIKLARTNITYGKVVLAITSRKHVSLFQRIQCLAGEIASYYHIIIKVMS